MPDERDELNSAEQNIPDEDKNVIDVVYDDLDDIPEPGIVRSIEDALVAVDKSGIPPAPVLKNPLPAENESGTKLYDGNKWQKKDRSPKQRVDKYGLPVAAPKGISPVAKMLAVFRPPASKEAIIPVKTDFPIDPEKVFIPESEASVSESARLLGEAGNDVTMPNFNKTKAKDAKEDFKIKFDFESAYKDPPENRPLRIRRERRTGLVGGLMFAVFILCVSLVLASVMWMATVDVLGFAAADEAVDVTVPEGFTMEVITDMLYEAGLIRYKALFNLYSEYSNAEEKISPGSYVLNMNYDYRALVQGMTARAGVRVEVTVTIPEGFTLAQIFNLLENEEVCTAEELWEAATHHDFDFHFLEKETLGNRLRLEGFLFPDTYNFYKDSTPVRALNRMLREFDNKFTEQYVERADDMGYTIREIITIASMIEREAGNDEERPRIAAVIYNRLNNPSSFPRLEIDATIFYAIAGTNIPFSTRVDSEFNTYIHEGLPPGPIANPGMASIRAALYPLNTNEYFYALNRNGTHNFFRNATDHINFVNSDEYGG